jgi:hypothetical protein
VQLLRVMSPKQSVGFVTRDKSNVFIRIKVWMGTNI